MEQSDKKGGRRKPSKVGKTVTPKHIDKYSVENVSRHKVSFVFSGNKVGQLNVLSGTAVELNQVEYLNLLPALKIFESNKKIKIIKL